MAYRINDNCFGCGRCYAECRNGAIRPGDGPGSIIKPERCTECIGWYETPRCFDCCYVDAPEPDPSCRESREDLLVKFKKLHPRKDPMVV